MAANPQELIETLRKNPKMLEQLMRSGDGMRLLQLLSAGDGGAGLRQAAAAAQAGNTEQMAALVKSIMESSEGKALGERLQKKLNRQ